MTENETLGFAVATIGSLWELELLLLLAKSGDRSWTPDELNRALLANRGIVGQSLARFCAKGIVVAAAADEYRYAPADDATALSVKALADLFAIKPFAVVNAIAGARRDGLQSFSDAFRLKDE